MRMIARLIFAVTGLAATGAISEILPWRGFLQFGTAFLLALPLALLAIVVHELGHAWAVNRLGGKVVGFTIFGVDLVGTLPVAVDPRLTGREIGGHVDYEFDGRETRREHALIAAAGPGANLLLAFFAAMIVWSRAESRSAPASVTTISLNAGSREPPSGRRFNLPSDVEIREWLEANPHVRHRGTGSGGLENIIAALAVMSAGIGLANLVPFKGSDGAALKDSLRPAWRR